MLDASVAANSELWMMPPDKRLLAVILAVSMRVANLLSPLRSTIRRRKLPLSSGTQRTVRRTSRWSSVVSADTLRPVRPSTFWRTGVSPRMKAAAAGSATPRRCSNDSGVSLERTCSERNSEKPGASSSPSTRFSASDSTG